MNEYLMPRELGHRWVKGHPVGDGKVRVTVVTYGPDGKEEGALGELDVPEGWLTPVPEEPPVGSFVALGDREILADCATVDVFVRTSRGWRDVSRYVFLPWREVAVYRPYRLL